jgi:hypothetical protein
MYYTYRQLCRPGGRDVVKLESNNRLAEVFPEWRYFPVTTAAGSHRAAHADGSASRNCNSCAMPSLTKPPIISQEQKLDEDEGREERGL